MPDETLVLEILRQIHQATQTILSRFRPINTVADFTHSDAGREKLDAI